MSRGTRHTTGVFFGWSEGAEASLWVRIDLPEDPPIEEQAQWRIELGDLHVMLPYRHAGSQAKEGALMARSYDKALVLRLAGGRESGVALSIAVIRQGHEVARYPEGAALMLPAQPDARWGWTL